MLAVSETTYKYEQQLTRLAICKDYVNCMQDLNNAM